MTSRERVMRTIGFQKPDRVPLLYFNQDKEQSDLLMIDVVENFGGTAGLTSEWGFEWEQLDGTMGQPKESVIKHWDQLNLYQAPPIRDETRFLHVESEKVRYGKDPYLLASLQLSGFTIMSFLRGFSELVEDLILEPEAVNRLADIVFGFEEEIIRRLKPYGFDGVAFFDDWGMQENMMVSPQLWRAMFKERYRKQFSLAHEHGLDVYFHTCGYVYPIIGDFIEIGVDLLNISQPNLYDIKQLGREYGGKVCFVCPVSYQTTSLTGTRDDIFADVRELVEHLGRFDGGLVGYVEEYGSIGMSDENYRHCIDAFRTLGDYRGGQ